MWGGGLLLTRSQPGIAGADDELVQPEVLTARPDEPARPRAARLPGRQRRQPVRQYRPWRQSRL